MESFSKTETVIFPNPNQLILLRELQKELCSVPALPLCVRSPELNAITDRITKAIPESFFEENGSVFLSIHLEINGKPSRGTIEFGEKRSGKAVPRLEEILVNPKLKKISPFRLVLLQSDEKPNGLIWKVLKEKWIKL